MAAAAANRRAIVVGAGIVGISSALELQRRQWHVTVVDRLAPGEGCSFGNAGILAAQAVVPVAMPGLMRKVPGMLLDPESPLVVRLGSLASTLPWLMHFRRAAKGHAIESVADAMKELNSTTVELHEQWAREAGVPDLIVPGRYLYVHRDARQLDTSGLAWRLRRERGSEIEVLEGAALHEAEPALSRDYTMGVRLGPMGYTLNPFRLTQAYARMFEARGGTVRRASVDALAPDGARVDVATSAGRLEAEVVVVAAGAWSARLVAPLGVKLQLIAERGYHMTFPKAGVKLNHVVSEVERQFAVTPMEMGLRVAGTEELGLADDPPAWRRADVLMRQASRMFPEADLSDGTRWMGPRPGTPDSLPFIGPVPNHPNVFVAAGHGHLGLTGGPATGRLVAAIASGERPNVPLEPYALDRFDGRRRAVATSRTAARVDGAPRP
jgi:D-amino-acid dehydrogenase